jgi:phosphatidate cytidylyltransferase
MKRILTSIVLLPLALYLVLWSPPPLLMLAAAAFATGCYHEFRGLASAYGFRTFGPLGYAAGLALLALPGDLFPLVVLIALLAISAALASPDLRTALPSAAVLLFGVLYTFGTWRFAVSLHRLDPHWLLFALMLNWVGDVAAYYAGRAWGRRKLAPSISPGKTWVGALASLAAAALFGWFYVARFLPQTPVVYAVPLALAANAAGQVGDLAESAMKRGAGVKDSGRLLPGHGGLLDRLESTMFTLPAVYVLAVILLA